MCVEVIQADFLHPEALSDDMQVAFSEFLVT